MLLSFIAALSFYLIPLFLGLFAFELYHLALRRTPHPPANLPSVWVTGVLFVFVSISTTNIITSKLELDIVQANNILTMVMFSLVFAGLFGVIKTVVAHRTTLLQIPKEWIFIGLLLFSLGVYLWRIDSPYPSPLNWDIYEHLTLSNELQTGKFSLQLRDYSDTFRLNTYLPFYHTILAAPQIIFAPNPLGYYWMLEVLHFGMTIAASTYLCWSISKNKWVTLFALVLGTFTFESLVAYTSLFHLPQTVAALFFVVCLAYLFRNQQHESRSLHWPIMIIWSLFLVGSHFFVGSTGAAILLATFIALRYLPSKLIFAGTIALMLLIMLAVIFNQTLSFNPFGSAESIYFNFDLKQKMTLLQNWYGYSFLALLPAGSLFMLKTKSKTNLVFIAITMAIILFIIIPFPYNLKIYTLGRYLTHVLMAVGIGLLITKLRYNLLQLFVAIAWLCFFVVVFYFNQLDFKQWIRYENIATHVSPAESQAAQFLKTNYTHQNVLLVSDPATQYVLEAISGLNTQGGAYATEETRLIVDQLYPNNDTQDIQSQLFSIHDLNNNREEPEKILFAISGRFFGWQNSSDEDKLADYFNIWRPSDLNLLYLPYIDMLNNAENFDLVFQNRAMAIFEVTQ